LSSAAHLVLERPAPFYFVTIPAQLSRDIKAVSKLVTYGWGVIP
jgi:hypothetical protein